MLTRICLLAAFLIAPLSICYGQSYEPSPVITSRSTTAYQQDGLSRINSEPAYPYASYQAQTSSEGIQIDELIPSIGQMIEQPEKTYPEIALTGFFQADAGWFSQDAANVAAFGDIQDFADFRRARLAAKGKVAEDVAYMVEFDFAFPGRPTFMDVYGEFQDVVGWGNIRIGQWRQPMSMDALTSVKELAFLERNSSFAAFLPFRQIGIGAFDTYALEQGTWALSVYKFPTSQVGTAVGDGGYGLSYRNTFAPLMDLDCDRVIHTGFGYSYNRSANNSLRFRSTPEIGVTAGDVNFNPVIVPFFVDTNNFGAEGFSLFNAELAAGLGPLVCQAEVYYVVAQTLAGTDATFAGAYAQAAYVLTGEHRKYNPKQGVFGRFVPESKDANGKLCPAWEVATRWSYLNLNDDAVQGGQLNDLTFGLTCRWNKFTMMQFNYIHAFQQQAAFGKNNADILAMRFQIDF